MKVKVINRYHDLERQETMEVGQKFEIKDEERARKLVQYGYVEVVAAPEKKIPEADAPAPKPAPKKRAAKKTE